MRTFWLAALVVSGLGRGWAAPTLEEGFAKPQDSARPWVYAFFLNGNLTSNGITTDLEAMKRAGLGGLTLLEVNQGTPKGPIAFGSPAWRGMFRHLCKEAQRLGLQVGMNNDAGWCGSGGPWITPELSMQKVVWTETAVAGPTNFEAALAHPETVKNFYRDIAVLAFLTPVAERVRMTNFSPALSTSTPGADFSATKLLDGDTETFVTLPHPQPDKPQFIQIEFPQPFTARMLRLSMSDVARLRTCLGAVEASDDGQVFRKVRNFLVADTSVSVCFPEVTARLFRILFTTADYKMKQLVVTDLELSPRLSVDNLAAKALFVGKKEFASPTEYSPVAEGTAASRSAILDLTSKLDKDGRLSWEVPPGEWTVLRFGHTTTAVDNHPAPEAGRGLECDKLSKAGADAIFSGFLEKIIEDNRELAGKTFVSTHIDSWEVGPQNWTELFPEEFRRLRGYDAVPFLPVLTGRAIEGLEVSERFLWDFRQTISDLLVENYAGRLAELAHQHGLQLSVEAYDGNPCEDLAYGGRADVPMGEFWSWVPYGLAFSCTEMASVAHIYGKPIVAAEAFTAAEGEKWLGHPFAVKTYGDWAFCEGVNRFVVHRYAFQPWPNVRPPGVAMGPFGLHYDRTETWWEESKPWHDYLARCQSVLQQGQFVADICYLATEKAPLRWQPPHPALERPSYNFDACPPEALFTRMSVKDGRFVLPDGMSYRLLVLPESRTTTPRLLGRIKELVGAGGTVVGAPPSKSPSLSDYPNCDAEVKRLSGELWGDCDGQTVKEHKLGKGKVVWGIAPEQVLASAGVPPDFTAQPRYSSQQIRYIHKTMGDREVYFLANRLSQPEEAWCNFRVKGMVPEFLNPDTGVVEHPAEFYTNQTGTTSIPIRFDPRGSLFVVFRPAGKNRTDRIDFVAEPGVSEDRLMKRRKTWATTNKLETTGEATNSFTMAGWVKPDADVELPPEAAAGSSGLAARRNDALYPPPGHEVYPEPGQAGSGLSVGRNGVCVFEHGCGHFAPVLVYGARLTNWTHVAVVYREGKPALLLNGKPVHEGLKSSFAVHPGVGVQHWRNPAPFLGSVGEFQKFDTPLSEAEVAALAEGTPVPGTVPNTPDIEFRMLESGRLQARLWDSRPFRFTTARGRTLTIRQREAPKPLDIDDPWELRFPAGWGAPESVSMESLVSWSEHSNPGVKYFSGAATYGNTFTLPAAYLAKSQRLYLDLGKVAVMAQVRLNGKDLGIFWKPPFRVDITAAAKKGENQLQVKVVNLWVNRMIGDEQLPEDSDRDERGLLRSWPEWAQEGKQSPSGRYTFTTWRLWKKNSPLQESGLLGPVRILVAREVALTSR